MDLREISINAVVVIPYRTFKDKIRIVKSEIEKGRHVEILDNRFIYSVNKKYRKEKINV